MISLPWLAGLMDEYNGDEEIIRLLVPLIKTINRAGIKVKLTRGMLLVTFQQCTEQLGMSAFGSQ